MRLLFWTQVTSNLRCIISGLIGKMDVEANRMHALTPRERNALVAIQSYLTLKRGEVWAEIEQELVLEDVVPIEVCVSAFVFAYWQLMVFN